MAAIESFLVVYLSYCLRSSCVYLMFWSETCIPISSYWILPLSVSQTSFPSRSCALCLFFKKSTEPSFCLCVVAVRLSTKKRLAFQGTHSRNPSTSNSPFTMGGDVAPSCLYANVLLGLISFTSCASSHSHCEFMYSVSLLYLSNSLSGCTSTTSNY